MKIVSFAWTSPAIRVRRKTCTRREWDDDYLRRFKIGDVIQAYNKSARSGGERMELIRLVDIYRERTCDMPDGDWEAEGFAYLTEIGAKCGDYEPIEVWDYWKSREDKLAVIRFDYDVTPLFTWAFPEGEERSAVLI